MKQSKIFVLRGTIFFLLLMYFITPVLNAEILYPELTAKSNLLIDADTGTVYIENNIDAQLGIASLTKLMSIYVIFDEIKAQDVNLDEKVTISQKVSDLKAQNQNLSGVYYYVGQEMSISELIDLALVYSDNGATIALGEYLLGSESKLVEKMNEKAKKLGMEQTYFYNASGLTMYDYGDYKLPGTKTTDYNVSSARDLGVLTYNLLNDYPETIDITSKPSIEYQGETYDNWNLMLEKSGFDYDYDGVKGLKTGTTIEAGECFIGYYQTEERNYISVVLGADSESGYDRFNETVFMYNWIDQQTLLNLISKDTPLDTIDIIGDSGGKVDLYVRSDIDILTTTNTYFILIDKELNPEYFNEDGILEKKIPKGEVVATYSYKVPKDNLATQNVLGDEETYKIELIAKEDIDEQFIVFKFFTGIKLFIQSLYN